MISLIIFILGVIVTYVTSYLCLGDIVGYSSIAWICLISIMWMIAANGMVAIICSKWLPNRFFNAKYKIYQAGKKECRFYEKIGIKKWKDSTAELGILNGFRKNKLNDPNSVEYIERFILENNKGFLTHLVSIFVGFLVIFTFPKQYWLTTALPVAITSFILNLLPLMILRYNMPRLQILLKYAQRRSK